MDMHKTTRDVAIVGATEAEDEEQYMEYTAARSRHLKLLHWGDDLRYHAGATPTGGGQTVLA